MIGHIRITVDRRFSGNTPERVATQHTVLIRLCWQAARGKQACLGTGSWAVIQSRLCQAELGQGLLGIALIEQGFGAFQCRLGMEKCLLRCGEFGRTHPCCFGSAYGLVSRFETREQLLTIRREVCLR